MKIVISLRERIIIHDDLSRRSLTILPDDDDVHAVSDLDVVVGGGVLVLVLVVEQPVCKMRGVSCLASHQPSIYIYC